MSTRVAVTALAGLLLPKCPLCLAAWLSAAGVGAGVAQSAAPVLLRVAHGVVAAAVTWLAVRLILRMRARWFNSAAGSSSSAAPCSAHRR